MKMYYLYEKSCKKLQELKEVAEEMSATFEFDETGVKPIRACGTRWIDHKTKAMQRVVGKFGVYMGQIESVTSNKEYETSMRQKCKGYLRQWKSANILLNMVFYQDLLEPLRVVSLIFQEKSVDVVRAAEGILKLKGKFGKLEKMEVRNFPRMEYLFRKSDVDEENDIITYQSVALKGWKRVLEQLEQTKVAAIRSVRTAFLDRIESGEEDYMKAVSEILNCKGWIRFQDDENFADEFVILIADIPTLLEEWHSMVSYTFRSLRPSSESYKATWKRLFSLPQAERNYKSILLIAEVCFQTPVSAAIVEKSFSTLKRVKNSVRNRLSTEVVESLIRIELDTPKTEFFDATAALKKWGSSASRRPNQKVRSYRKRVSKQPSFIIPTSSSEDESDSSS